eukprot:2839740-Amphidinium_carterae.1
MGVHSSLWTPDLCFVFALLACSLGLLCLQQVPYSEPGLEYIPYKDEQQMPGIPAFEAQQRSSACCRVQTGAHSRSLFEFRYLLQSECVMCQVTCCAGIIQLIEKDLSEPYSIFTYRLHAS